MYIMFILNAPNLLHAIYITYYRQLSGNALNSMETNGLKYLKSLRTLRLEGNLFNRIPTNALNELKSLEAL